MACETKFACQYLLYHIDIICQYGTLTNC